nr:hypothetical protein [uncultured Halomonas sp.]
MLIAKGATFNQFDMTPFDMGLVIFDATDEGQVEVALQQRDELEARDDIRQVVFMMTDMETLDGWDVFEALSDRFDRPLHLLTPDVAERFEIERTPTVITATDTHFEVKEMVASRLGSLNAGTDSEAIDD